MSIDPELKSIESIEKMIKENDLSKLAKSISIIEDQFTKYAYLKSLIEMKRENCL